MCQPRLPWIHSAGHRPTIFLYILIFLPQATGIQGSFCSCGQGKVSTAVPPVLTGSAARAAFLPAGLNSWTTTEPQESLLVGLGLMSHSPSREGFADGVVSLYPISWAGVRGPCRAKRLELLPMHLENREPPGAGLPAQNGLGTASSVQEEGEHFPGQGQAEQDPGKAEPGRES